jgi:hypothetical protein
MSVLSKPHIHCSSIDPVTFKIPNEILTAEVCMHRSVSLIKVHFYERVTDGDAPECIVR